jgi:hypothetical protein
MEQGPFYKLSFFQIVLYDTRKFITVSTTTLNEMNKIHIS